ncbi:MAG TPA: hypothetical protein VLC71_04275 [Thermomonas sp.]|nr:hypothetical protein [Thermomonas sp.]
MHSTSLSITAAMAACLLLGGCGKDPAKGSSGAAGEDGLPQPDAVSGSVTGMPNPGASTPNPGQPVDAPAVVDPEAPDATVPVEGEVSEDPDGMPQTATPEPPEPETMPMPPAEAAVPASGNAADTPGAGQP